MNKSSNLIELILTNQLPYLSAEDANKEIIKLNIKILELQAIIDAWKINQKLNKKEN